MLLVAIAPLAIGCQSSKERVKEAQEDANEANAELEDANEEYMRDIEETRKITAEKAEANERAIAQFNARVALKKENISEEYRQKMEDLNKKNSDFKKRMDEYKASGKEKWMKFKTEFNRDMDELGTAIANLAREDNK